MQLNLKRLLFLFLGIFILLPCLTYAQFEKGLLMEGLVTNDLWHPSENDHFGCSFGAFGRYNFYNQNANNYLFLEANLGLTRLRGLPLVGVVCNSPNAQSNCVISALGYQIDYLILISLSAGVKVNLRNTTLISNFGAEFSHFPDLWRHSDGFYGEERNGLWFRYNPNALNAIASIGIPVKSIKLIDSLMLTYRHPIRRHYATQYQTRKQLGITLKLRL